MASSEALDLLHRAVRTVTYWRISMAIKMATKVGVFILVVLFAVTLAAAGAIQSN